jgi:ABC-2 type transport system permease protein
MLSHSIILLKTRLSIIPRSFATMDRGRRLLVIPFTLLAAGFALLMYVLTGRVIDFLLSQDEIGQTLLVYGLSTVFSVFFLLAIVSSTITASGTLFKSAEIKSLFPLPIMSMSVFIYKTAETTLYSIWMIFLLILPLLLALVFSLHNALSAFFYLLFSLPCLLVLGSLLGIILSFGLQRFLLIQKKGVKFATILLVMLVLFLGRNWTQKPGSLLPDLGSFVAIGQYLQKLQTSSPYLPSSWLVNGFFACNQGNFAESIYFSMLLASNLLMAGWLLYHLAKKTYQPLIWLVNSQSHQRSKQKSTLHDLPFGQRILALAEKDLKMFYRDPRQWVQTLLIAGIFLVYVTFLSQVPSRFQALEVLFATLIAYLAFASLGYFITTLALRFVFPAMSLEGKSFWFILTSPLKRTHLLTIKIFPLLIFLLSLTTAGSLLLSKVISLPAPLTYLSLGASLASVLSLTILTFGVGTIWINLEENDPAKLASSIPAIITTMLIFGFLTLITFLLSLPFDNYFQHLLFGSPYQKQIGWLVLAIITGLSLILSGVMLYLTKHFFEQKDF